MKIDESKLSPRELSVAKANPGIVARALQELEAGNPNNMSTEAYVVMRLRDEYARDDAGNDLNLWPAAVADALGTNSEYKGDDHKPMPKALREALGGNDS